MFFFPETMLARMKKIENDVFRVMIKHGDADSALDQFNARCKEYLGFGYLASFIPTTNAFKARKALSAAIDKVMPDIEFGVNRIPNIDSDNNVTLFHRWEKRTALSGVITNILLLGPLWDLLDKDFNEHFRYTHITYNRNISLIRLISMFPLINNIFFVDEYREAHLYPWSKIGELFIHDLLNAFRIVNSALFFLHQCVDRILEIGATKRDPSNVVRSGLKGIAGLVFFVAAIPVKIAEKAVDACYGLLANIVLRPLIFISSSIYAKWSNRNTAPATAVDKHEQTPLLTDPATQLMYKTVGISETRPQATHQQLQTEADDTPEILDFRRRLTNVLDNLEDAEDDHDISDALGSLKALKSENTFEHDRFINKSAEFRELYRKYPNWEMKLRFRIEDRAPSPSDEPSSPRI